MLLPPQQELKLTLYSYNRYLAVSARVVRRSLKEGPRLQAERRGEMELRFARWEVSPDHTVMHGRWKEPDGDAERQARRDQELGTGEYQCYGRACWRRAKVNNHGGYGV